MKMKERGFTLIELVMVIVILGILSAVAIPKFVDLSTEAKTAAVKGVAGAYGAGHAINYATCAAVGGTSSAKCIAVNNCNTAGLVTDNSGAVVTPGALTSGNTATCTVTLNALTSTFTGIGAP